MQIIKIILMILLAFISVNTFADDSIQTKTQNQIMEDAISHIDTNLSVEDFKQTIKGKYYSTYRFLEKLSSEQKQEVYKYYQSEPNFNAIRHKIFGLFFDSL